MNSHRGTYASQSIMCRNGSGLDLLGRNWVEKYNGFMKHTVTLSKGLLVKACVESICTLKSKCFLELLQEIHLKARTQSENGQYLQDRLYFFFITDRELKKQFVTFWKKAHTNTFSDRT